MFLSPFLLFGAWRLAAARGIPSGATVAMAAGTLVVVLGILLWFSEQGAMPGGATYVPAHLQDGHIVPGRAVP